MKRRTFFVSILCLVLLLSSCSVSKLDRKTKTIDSNWKYQSGDNIAWASNAFDDSSWQELENFSINFDKKNNFFWLRKTVTIPEELKGQEIWLGLPKINAACEVYADGIYVGSRGSMPPATNVRVEIETDIHIPSTCIHDGKVQLAVRFFLPGMNLVNLGFHLDNTDMAFYQNSFKNIFNNKIFVILAILSLFFIFYALLQFLMDDHASEYIFFVLSVLFISLYFYDLGAETQLFEYNGQHSIFRSFLSVGMLFLYAFLNRFFDRKHFKFLISFVVAAASGMVILFACFTGHDNAIELCFTVGLGFIVAGIVYGFVCTIHAVRTGQKDAIPILIGFALGTAIAMHDIICQIAGIVPFMWIQGLAFFVVDLSIFITLAIRQLKSKHRVQLLAKKTEDQKESLKELIDNAQVLADESSAIASSLNESVMLVVEASDRTQRKIDDINLAIKEQNRVQTETNTAVHNLTGFLDTMNTEVQTETDIISKTVNQTQEVISGIAKVSEGLESAAEFTSSLSTLTRGSAEDTKQLMTVMDEIQASSKEILGVVTTLDNFANQIDLLSMNASIEAAHSGAAGKGFSVIAHEIKKLASSTSQWSSKIGEIITNIIGQITLSVELANKVNDAISQIKEGSVLSAEKVNSASEGMKAQEIAGNEITQGSRILYDSASKMKEEVLNQSSFSTQVLSNMESLSTASSSVEKASQDIAYESGRLNEEAKKLGELANRTAESSKKLLDMMK